MAQASNSQAILITEQSFEQIKIQECDWTCPKVPQQGGKALVMHTAENKLAERWPKLSNKHQTGIWSSLVC